MKIIIEEFGETLLTISAGIICFILLEQLIAKLAVVIQMLVDSLI